MKQKPPIPEEKPAGKKISRIQALLKRARLRDAFILREILKSPLDKFFENEQKF